MTDVKQMLELYFKLRETKKEYIPIYELSNRNPWTFQIRDDLKEAFDLDPEGLTALLILDNFRNDFFSFCGLSIKDILENKNFDTFIGDCRRLTNMLSEEEIVNALSDFIESVSGALKAIGVERKDVAEMVNDRYEMGILRRDSLRSMQVLSFHQFFQGDVKADHLTFLPDIHMFWNMNSLIRCAWQSEDGVSINLIKDPMETSSYFAFVAKNGGNLSILTDKPREAHPLSKYMSRRPEKDFTRRVFRNHFPYGLMDLHYDHKDYLHPGRTALIPLQEKPIKIGSLSELLPDEIIWTVMMFSLIDAKLYKDNYHCEELSYTSDMIADPGVSAALINGNLAGALMVKDYKPLIAPVLTPESLENDPQYSKYSGSGPHEWLYERYKDQIPNDILNGLRPNDDTTIFLLPDSTVYLAPPERIEKSFYHTGDPVLLADPKAITWHSGPWGGKVTTDRTRIEDAVVLKKMTGDEFGTQESLIEDYKWFARYNEAKFIRQKADAEYLERKDSVRAWAKRRIEQNLERICKDIVRSKSVGDKAEHPCRFSMTEMKGEWWREVSTHDTITFAKDRKARFRRTGTECYPLHNNADAGCWFSEDAPCSYILKAHAIYVSDLLYLTDCTSVDELPDVLQHWMHSGYYHGNTGNHILSRVDPMDWVVQNPWDKLHFDVVIGIGKKYLAKLKKEL